MTDWLASCLASRRHRRPHWSFTHGGNSNIIHQIPSAYGALRGSSRVMSRPDLTPDSSPIHPSVRPSLPLPPAFYLIMTYSKLSLKRGQNGGWRLVHDGGVFYWIIIEQNQITPEWSEPGPGPQPQCRPRAHCAELRRESPQERSRFFPYYFPYCHTRSPLLQNLTLLGLISWEQGRDETKCSIKILDSKRDNIVIKIP